MYSDYRKIYLIKAIDVFYLHPFHQPKSLFMKTYLASFLLSLCLILPQGLLAQTQKEFEKLQTQVDQLSLKLEKPASTTVGGYAELHYNAPQEVTTQFDFHRFVLILKKEINSWIRFNAELELEHALVNNGQGELEIEQAGLTFTINNKLEAKAGVLLLPVGLINVRHEPNTFYGVDRPDVNKYVIPTTLIAEGAGLSLNIGDSWNLQGYLVAGLDAAGFSGGNALRKGRQQAYKSDAESIAQTGRLQYNAPGATFGFSFYQGDAKTVKVAAAASQAGVSLDAVPFGLYTADLDIQQGNFTLRSEIAQGVIGNSAALNQIYGQNVGASFSGYYVEPSYKFWFAGDQAIGTFARFEDVNPQKSMESGSSNGAYNFTNNRVGVNYWPHPDIAIKWDMGSKKTKAVNALAQKDMNLGVGWSF